MNAATNTRLKWSVCALLGAAVLAVFAPALRCAFVGLDDPDYITDNKGIQHGLNWASIHWAFTTTHASNWHPLTWITHIVDWQLYGPHAFGHHLTNLLLHVASSMLLFLLLHRMTGALGRSAFVAAIFALHPLRVESVVWVAERKDVLSTSFWMLTVLAYVRFTEESNSRNSASRSYYGLSVLFFALGLMAKSMLVTLPCVLLLLDYWPLRRLALGRRLLLEKVPYFAAAAAASAVTFLVQNRFGVVASLAKFSLAQRIANIPIAYVRYLEKIFWPSGLNVFYGYSKWSAFQVIGAVALLAAITAWALKRLRTQPYLAVGWFWFLGMLVPTIGIVQVGNQSMADRYSYLPSVGISIMVAWWVFDFTSRRPAMLKLAAAGGGLAIAACAVLTPIQIQYWKTPTALYVRAADFSDQDCWTCYNIGVSALQQRSYARAIRCFERALRVAPDDGADVGFQARAHNDLGCALLEEGQVSNALTHFENALTLQVIFPQAYYNMGRAFLTNRQPDLARPCFRKALEQAPNAPEVFYGLGESLELLGRWSDAQDVFQRAVQFRPNWAAAHYKLANALAARNDFSGATAHYAKALELRPDFDEAANNLAWILATCPNHSFRDGPKALALARQAASHNRERNPVILGTLAAAYAETGDLSNAVVSAQRAQALALEQTNRALAGALEEQLRNYREGRHP